MAKLPVRKNISAETTSKRIEEAEALRQSISDSVENKTSVTIDVNIESIASPTFHDRRWHDKMAIIELSKSIEAVGLIYPVVLRKVGEGFERIIGYRRIEAYKILGRETIPAIVLENVDDDMAILLMATENMQREDISIYDETLALIDYLKVAINESQEGIEKLLIRFKNHDAGSIKLTDDEKEKRVLMNDVLKKTGKIEISGLLNRLTMLSMHPLIKEELSASKLSFSNAQVLQKLSKNEDTLKTVMDRVIDENMSKRETMKLISEYKEEIVTNAKEGDVMAKWKSLSKTSGKQIAKLNKADQDILMDYFKKIDEILNSKS
jgi:ParB family chromosome partitioning protein